MRLLYPRERLIQSLIEAKTFKILAVVNTIPVFNLRLI